ncbi:uncharacterized protein C1orf159 homolog isoform X1 [Dipodomys merriami]|uniref:uncharacterized protein C1orf159 homolog isoform X1 n=1 Tax=Dipodomys merriami TaxID=94247 RepID=UPI00385567E3
MSAALLQEGQILHGTRLSRRPCCSQLTSRTPGMALKHVVLLAGLLVGVTDKSTESKVWARRAFLRKGEHTEGVIAWLRAGDLTGPVHLAAVFLGPVHTKGSIRGRAPGPVGVVSPDAGRKQSPVMSASAAWASLSPHLPPGPAAPVLHRGQCHLHRHRPVWPRLLPALERRRDHQLCAMPEWDPPSLQRLRVQKPHWPGSTTPHEQEHRDAWAAACGRNIRGSVPFPGDVSHQRRPHSLCGWLLLPQAIQQAPQGLLQKRQSPCAAAW